MKWTVEDDKIAALLAVVLIVGLLLIRACIPPIYHHPAERPQTPPESLYTPGG